jgi:uncharacterized membrane protein YciS (DUF1049 family)
MKRGKIALFITGFVAGVIISSTFFINSAAELVKQIRTKRK